MIKDFSGNIERTWGILLWLQTWMRILHSQLSCMFGSCMLLTKGAVVVLFQLPSFIGQHFLTWEGMWREVTGLSKDASFAIRKQAGHSLKSSLKVSIPSPLTPK